MSKKKKAKETTKETTTEMTKTKSPVYKSCHTGNFSLFDIGKRSLQLGGWSKSPVYDSETVVIDLTGKEAPEDYHTLSKTGIFKPFLDRFLPDYYEWLSFPVTDFGLPVLIKDDWTVLYETILNILTHHKKDVLICCQGGHGRTGMFGSILGSLHYRDYDEAWKDDPVAKLRSVYCKEAVDTESQENYVYKMLGLSKKADPKDYIKVYSYNTYKTPGTTEARCVRCGIGGWYAEHYGLCYSCQAKSKAEIKGFAVELGLVETSVLLKESGKDICFCGDKNCPGIYMASCGHAIHGQIMSTYKTFGVCEECGKTSRNNAYLPDRVDPYDY